MAKLLLGSHAQRSTLLPSRRTLAVGFAVLGLQAPQQEVQVDEALEGLPSGEDPLHAVVVERFQDPEPALQVVAGADVVAREHVQASEPPQQDVLRGPAADTAQGAQPRHGRRIVEVLELVEIDAARGDGARELDDRFPLLPAEAEDAQLVRRAPGEVVRRREGVSSIAWQRPDRARRLPPVG